jgi:uncharacterized protein (TIGR03437 family)
MASKLLFLACFVVSIGAFAQAPQFTIQDLGVLPNLPACNAVGLSQGGNVVGYCSSQPVDLIKAPTTHGFLYSKGVMTDLNLTAQPTALPMTVNDSGVVAGAYLDINLSESTGTDVPFIVQNGTVTLPTGPMTAVLPFGLNNAGQLAGTSIQVSAESANIFIDSSAVLYTLSSGATTTLPSPSGQGGTAAFGINSTGTVAGGTINRIGTTIDPLLWQNGSPLAFSILSAFQQSLATSVNDSGIAAGIDFNLDFDVLVDPSALAHAVLFTADRSVGDLGVLPNTTSSMATGINNSGWVVGFSTSNTPDFTLQLAAIFYPAATTYQAFLYANGQMYNLNTLLGDVTGWNLSFATAINNAGQIVGTGLVQGPSGSTLQHAFLLTPVPAAPAPSITNVEGGGLSNPAVTSISNNGLFTIFGSGLAAAKAGLVQSEIVNNELPTTLGGTCVQGGNSKFGLLYVAPGQVNALASDLPSSGTVAVSVITNCGTANEVATPVVNVPVAASAPEFVYFIQNPNGQDPVAAIEAVSGAYVGAPGLIAGATFAPAKAGDVLTAFGVGWGPTTSTEPVGTIDTAAEALTSPYKLTLGGVPVDVSYAGLAPNYAGVYQINFTVPTGLKSGNQALVLDINGISTPSQAYITVTN